MATIPRSGPLPAPTSVTGGRSSPPTRVSSAGRGSVEDIPGGNGISFDSAAFGFQEEGQVAYNNGSSGRRSGRGFPGFVDAPSKVFAAMLESADFTKDNSESPEAGSPGSVAFVGLASKAIQIYETNARVAGGERPILGKTVSVVL